MAGRDHGGWNYHHPVPAKGNCRFQPGLWVHQSWASSAKATADGKRDCHWFMVESVLPGRLVGCDWSEFLPHGCWVLWISLLGDRTVTLELLPEKCQHGVYPHLLIEYLSYSPALQMTHSSWQREKITRVCVTHALPLQSVCTCLHARVCMHMHTELTCETSVLVGPCASPSNPNKSFGLLHFSKSEAKMCSLASNRVAFSGQSTRSRSPRQIWRKWQSTQQPPCQGSRLGKDWGGSHAMYL